ncbi:MAG: protease complex subunit PrcB family protein [Allomuricauda sp.]
MRFLALLLLTFCLFSCKAQKELAGEKMEDLELVVQDGYSGIMEYETMVIQDTKSLNKFYSQVNKTRKPGLPVPMVDFSREMVIVVCLGEQQGEKQPMLSKINETEDELTIAVELSDPEKTDTAQNQAISYPFYLYKIPLSSKTIGFQKVGW